MIILLEYRTVATVYGPGKALTWHDRLAVTVVSQVSMSEFDTIENYTVCR